MATLPTVPGPFADGTAPTLVQLQQLAGAVSFISDCDVRPTWHLYQTNTQSLSASTWTNLGTAGGNNVAFDSDGVSSGSGVATIVTQGYYAVEACADIAVSSPAFTFLVAFLWKAGANNPHFTNGTTLRFGARGGNIVTDASANTAYCASDICPNVCYPGDTIVPQVFASAAIGLKYNTNDAYNEGRFVANFTGYFISEGT